MSFKIDIIGVVKGAVNQVNAELPVRAAAASVKLKNASVEVLRGQRSGKVYKKPGTYGKRMNKQTKELQYEYNRHGIYYSKLRGGQLYRASAPGEPPASRTGTLKNSWRSIQSGPNRQYPAIETNVPYAWLDQGSPGGMIAPRPYEQKTLEKAWPEVEAIYAAPFNIDL
ncbi:MAG: hypothetical protein RR893_07290 [Clostridia bacterium]